MPRAKQPALNCFRASVEPLDNNTIFKSRIHVASPFERSHFDTIMPLEPARIHARKLIARLNGADDKQNWGHIALNDIPVRTPVQFAV